jgi:hypothetical protein
MLSRRTRLRVLSAALYIAGLANVEQEQSQSKSKHLLVLIVS